MSSLSWIRTRSVKRTRHNLEPAQVGVSLLDHPDLEEAGEVVGVGQPDAMGDSALGLDDVGAVVGVKDAGGVLAVSDEAELASDAGDGIGLLDVGRSLEPLALHRGGHEVGGDDHGVAVPVDRPDVDLHLDFFHIQLQ